MSKPLKPLRVLIVEDSEGATQLLLGALRQGGYQPIYKRVGSACAMKYAFGEKRWDLILANYALSNFSGLAALRILGQQPLDIPFIVVSEDDGERAAAEVMRAGAQDYIRMGNLARLVPAIERELREAAVRRENQRAKAELEARVRQQAAVADLGQRALAGIELGMLLAEATALVAQTLVVDYCAILALLPDGGHFRLQAGFGWQPGLVGQLIVAADSRTQAGYTLRAGEPLIVEDLNRETRFGRMPVLEAHQVRSSMTVIIQGQEKPYGILGAYATEQRKFSNDDIHFLLSVAVMLAQVIERKRTETALMQSEQYFRALSENALDIVAILDNDYTVRYISASIQSILGYRPEALLGHDFFTLAHPHDQAKRGAIFGRDRAGGATTSLEIRLRHRDNSWHLLEAIVKDMRADPVVAGVVINARDISERKRAEEALRELNESLEQRVADRTRELTALYDVTAAASKVMDLRTTLDRLLERVLLAMRCQAGVILLMDEDELALHLAVQRGWPTEIVGRGNKIPLDDGVIDWITRNTPPLLVHAMPPQDDYFSYIGAPMRASGRILGLLNVYADGADHYFNDGEVALLTTIADQVGVVVENARLRHRSEQAAITKERERLARELHDSVTQSLYSLNLLAGGGQRLARTGHLDNIEYYLGELQDIAMQGLKEMRLLVHQLRPSILEQVGLVGALQQRLDAVEARVDIDSKLLIEGVIDLSALVEEAVYRIAQEALNNALKHANASRVTVHLHATDGRIRLEVTDNGRGFNPEAIENQGGLGLISMRQRTERLGGRFTIFSQPGNGTTVTVDLSMKQVSTE